MRLRLGNYLQLTKKNLLRNHRLYRTWDPLRELIRHHSGPVVFGRSHLWTVGRESSFLSPEQEIDYEKDTKRRESVDSVSWEYFIER